MTLGRWLLVLAGVGACLQETTTDNVAATDSTDPAVELAPCSVGEAPPRPFDSSEGGLLWGDLASDFTVTELDGSTWTLSENWTGCDSYVFINFFPDTTEGEGLFASAVDELVQEAPANVHFFFTSDEGGPARRTERMQAMSERFDLGPQRAARVHFVTDRVSRIEGSVGAMVTDYLAYRPDSGVDLGERGVARAPYPAFFGIDREQQWDSGGSTSDFVGGSPTIQMAAYLPMFYNHKVELAHQLASEEATETVVLDETVTDRVLDRTVNLPDDLSAFDTLEFDIAVTCPYRNVFACSEWDRIARIDVCLDGETCEDRRELVRWITPYWRRGTRRWAIDATPLMGLLSGGATTFRIEMGPSWERATERHTRMSVRLMNRGEADRATGGVRLYTGGTFDGTYIENRPATTFTPAASATRAELVVILSGHGQSAGNNCAEWCDHRHAFSVNGNALDEIRHVGGIGNLGCAPYASQGVSPGQYGNWAPLRAYWCPGLPVEAKRIDITEHVQFGEENELSYLASFQGDRPPSGGSISLSVYVAWFE